MPSSLGCTERRPGTREAQPGCILRGSGPQFGIRFSNDFMSPMTLCSSLRLSCYKSTEVNHDYNSQNAPARKPQGLEHCDLGDMKSFVNSIRPPWSPARLSAPMAPRLWAPTQHRPLLSAPLGADVRAPLKGLLCGAGSVARPVSCLEGLLGSTLREGLWLSGVTAPLHPLGGLCTTQQVGRGADRRPDLYRHGVGLGAWA